MAGERSTEALKRIDAAIARIEAAAAMSRAPREATGPDKNETIRRVRGEVAASIAEIDRIIANVRQVSG